MDFPRLLVITSNNFNLVRGGGITLTNLFRGWPAGLLANLHEDSLPQDESVCRDFYRLTNSEVRLVWPFSMFSFDSNGGSAVSTGSGAAGSLVRVSRKLFGDGIPRRFVMSEELRRWLDEFRPEIVYSFLGSMAQIRVTAAVVERFQIPFVVHIMDDWPAVAYRRGVFGSRLRRIMMSEFSTLLRRSQVRLAISPEMSAEYKERFGYSFLPFHNAIDMNEWLPRSRQSWRAGSRFVVRYAGSILEEAQRDALLDICTAVSNLKRSGVAIEMWVHAPRSQRRYLEQLSLDGLHCEDSPDPASIVESLASADLLVLPFNFDEPSAEYVRLSMPTKVPAYMASGTPTLVYGPSTIAPVRYAMREGWGYVLFERGTDIVESAIRRLMHDEGLRRMHGQRARALALERHDASRVRMDFQNVLVEAAGRRTSVRPGGL